MKTIFNSLNLIMAALLLAVAGTSAATFTNLHTFTAVQNAQNNTNSDGAEPWVIVVSGNTIYGTAAGDGAFGQGTVYRVDTDGTHFTNLFNFPALVTDPLDPPSRTNEGTAPEGLVISGNTLYGMTDLNGPEMTVANNQRIYGLGTVFKIDTDGSNFGLLHTFYDDGSQPGIGIYLYGNTLYCTATEGGANSAGSIVTVGIDGSGSDKLYDFAYPQQPFGAVVLSSNALYGFSASGGPDNKGLMYRLIGTNFTDLLDFTGTNGDYPFATPTLAGNTIYGVTQNGGTNGAGNVFRVNTDGNDYTNLYSFPINNALDTNGDLPFDYTGLVLSGNKLYGTTQAGGGNHGQDSGTIFQLNTDGTGYTVLHSFSGSTDGSDPESLVLVGNTLYGTTRFGGGNNTGTVFALILAPQLNIQLTNKTVVLTWNDPSFSLYSAPAVNAVFTNIPSATSPYTNATTASQMFFLLQAN